jgi:integrase
MRETTEKVIGDRRTPHCLRHTHASLLFADGVSIDTISRRLGHENSKITREIYLHIIEKVKEKDREILSTKRILKAR